MPRTTPFSGTSSTTTEFAQIAAPSATRSGPITLAPAPRYTRSPSTGAFVAGYRPVPSMVHICPTEQFFPIRTPGPIRSETKWPT